MSMNQPDTAKLNHAYEMAQRFEEEFEYDHLGVLEAFHDASQHPDWPAELVHVVFEGVDGHSPDGDAYGSRFTKPAVDYARENGLEVMDHVVYVGHEAEEDYDTEAAIKIRFYVADDYDE